MIESAPGSDTPHTVLNRVRDPRDEAAWLEFFAYCDPKLRRFARELHLDPHSTDEVCREAWHRLWIKIQRFEYEPGKRFRHWLWIFFKRQAIDYLKMRGRERHLLSRDLQGVRARAIDAGERGEEGAPS